MPKRKLDHSDVLILNILQNEGNISNKDLAKRLGIATATTLKRVLRLKRLNLLPSSHYLLNKELAGYKELFLVKISLAPQLEHTSALESYLLKDSLVEQVWTVYNPDALGTVQYKAMVRAQTVETFKEWCTQLMAKNQCLMEHEQVDILLKERSSLKLSYKDLQYLRSLEDGAEENTED